MNNIKTQFTIKDLENLSGIKAHTIRIWEKRYNILSPNRTNSNIRYYDIENLQKLLNVALLYNSGYKISKMASLNEDELQTRIREHISQIGDNEQFSNSLNIAMLKFDQNLFEFTYNKMLAKNSFRDIFTEVFIPFLKNIGLEWQSKTITPAHEHFVSNLILQKLYYNIDKAQQIPPKNTDRVFVLYLPLNEIHELGLLFIHYETIIKGYHSIYLGQSIEVDDLKALHNNYQNITFVSYFTVKPAKDEVIAYFKQFQDTIINTYNSQLYVLGRNIENLEIPDSIHNVCLFHSINELLESL